MKYTFIPHLQFRLRSIIRYELPHVPFRRENQAISSNPFLATEEKPEVKQAYSGTVTAGAKKRIARAVSLLIQTSPTTWIVNPVNGKRQKFTLGFLTLTVSESERLLTAKEAHKLLLEPYLRILRNRYKVGSYIWKAELQNRGQIHYHLTINKFINWEWLRFEWNKLQDKAGLLENFYAKYGHKNPNSTDIHSVKNIRNLEAYLIKYLSKSEPEKGATTGKIWDCSKNLKEATYFTEIENSHLFTQIAQLQELGLASVKVSDHCQIITFKGIQPVEILNITGKERFGKWVKSIRK